jgi:hypothetical protein
MAFKVCAHNTFTLKKNLSNSADMYFAYLSCDVIARKWIKRILPKEPDFHFCTWNINDMESSIIFLTFVWIYNRTELVILFY